MGSASSPSVTSGDTSPWRGRIKRSKIATSEPCEPYEEKKLNLPPSLKGRGWGWVGFRKSERAYLRFDWLPHTGTRALKLADPPPTPPFQGGESARRRIPFHQDRS